MTSTVMEALQIIFEKIADNGPMGKDQGIYKPLHEESGIKGGKWLKNDKTLEHYDLRNNVRIRFVYVNHLRVRISLK